MEDHEYDYDIKTTVEGPLWGELPIARWTDEIKVSGEDIHMISNRHGGGVREHIVKDGVFYTKPPGGTWEYPPSDGYGIDYIYSLINTRPSYAKETSAHILCDREGADKARIGHYVEEMIVGPEHIIGNLQLPPEQIAEIPDTQITWEYWIGEDGKIQKSRQRYATIGREDWRVRETTAEISGVGEPNVITAPVVQ